MNKNLNINRYSSVPKLQAARMVANVPVLENIGLIFVGKARLFKSRQKMSLRSYILTNDQLKEKKHNPHIMLYSTALTINK